MPKTVTKPLTCYFGTPWEEHAQGCVACQEELAKALGRFAEGVGRGEWDEMGYTKNDRRGSRVTTTSL